MLIIIINLFFGLGFDGSAEAAETCDSEWTLHSVHDAGGRYPGRLDTNQKIIGITEKFGEARLVILNIVDLFCKNY